MVGHENIATTNESALVDPPDRLEAAARLDIRTPEGGGWVR